MNGTLVDVSNSATLSHTGLLIHCTQDCVLDVKHHKPDVVDTPTHHTVMEFKDTILGVEVPMRQPFARPLSRHLSSAPYVDLSPTGRSTIPIAGCVGNVNWAPKSDDGSGFRSRYELGRYHDLRSANQNFVDIERIRCGADVRTTVSICFLLSYQISIC